MAPMLASPFAATSWAEPAVSARTIGFSPCCLMNLRHCESA